MKDQVVTHMRIPGADGVPDLLQTSPAETEEQVTMIAYAVLL